MLYIILMIFWSQAEQKKSMRKIFRWCSVSDGVPSFAAVWSACKVVQVPILPGLHDLFRTQITREGVQPTQEQIRAIKEAPIPQNKTELKSFLGMLTYNVRFFQSLPDIMHPLYQLVKKDVKWAWHKRHDKAFREAKKLVSAVPVLAYYDADKPVKLYCDAFP